MKQPKKYDPKEWQQTIDEISVRLKNMSQERRTKFDIGATPMELYLLLDGAKEDLGDMMYGGPDEGLLTKQQQYDCVLDCAANIANTAALIAYAFKRDLFPKKARNTSPLKTLP